MKGTDLSMPPYNQIQKVARKHVIYHQNERNDLIMQ